MILSEKEYYALLRNDLSLFIHRTFKTVNPGERYLANWHIDAIAYHIEQCLKGDIKRLVITLPPRSLKSIITSVALPAYALGKDPSLQIVCASYSQNLANKHARDNLAVMQSDWYQRCFPKTRLHPKKQSESEFMTTRHGMRFSTSVGGTLTGRGGSLIIIDDPAKADEALSDTTRQNCIDWYRNTLSSRLNNKRDDCMILIQQRLHEEDLAGFVLEHEDWTHLNIPAIAEEDQAIPIGRDAVHIRKEGEALHPARESLDVLAGIKHTSGSYIFAAQYQQRPMPMEGGLVKRDWFKFYKATPEKDDNSRIVQSWDTACKAEDHNDYSVCTTWMIKENKYYLLDVLRKRLEYPELLKRMKAHAKHHHASQILIEDKGAGTSALQELKRHTKLNVKGIEPKGDKPTRLYTVTPIMEAGRVFLPKDASWLDTYLHEMLLFNKSKHDDQVDSTSQFLQWAEKHGQPGNFAVYIAYSPYADDYNDPLLHPSLYYSPPHRW